MLLGICPAPIADHADAVRALIDKDPGADVKPVVTLNAPGGEHPAYAAKHCPICGTRGSDR